MMKLHVYKTSFPFFGDTLELFRELNDDGGDKILLESRDGRGEKGMQSLIFSGLALRVEGRGQTVVMEALNENGRAALEALAPELAAVFEVADEGDRLIARFASRPRAGSDIDRIKAPSVLDSLRLLSQGWQSQNADDPKLRIPGIFSYDLLGGFEALPPAKTDSLEFPDFVFWLPDRTILLNHVKKKAAIIAHIFGGAGNVPRGEEELFGGLMASFERASAKRDDGRPLPCAERLSGQAGSEAAVDLNDEAFAELVEALKDHIRAGDVFQIVPSRTFSTPCPDPLTAFEALRELNPSPYMFFLNWNRYTLLGSSPETCVKVSGIPRKVEIHPIAGTRPRGITPGGEIDPEMDSRLQAELMLNEKELAEHMMLVDLARNDVARVSKPGTRRVVRLAEVERYSHVMHLVSVVEGELKDELDALHAYVASMNMGTLVGAPKIEAARLLRRYEADQRGPYGGAVGYLTSAGELDTAIVIRSTLVENGVARVRAGAGVVWDSIPQQEADETRSKAGAVLKAVRAAKETQR